MAKDAKAAKATKPQKEKKVAEKGGKPAVKGTNPAVKVDIKNLAMPPKLIPEEVLRTILAVILFLLFLLLFGGAAWYFLTQVDTTLVSGTPAGTGAGAALRGIAAMV